MIISLYIYKLKRQEYERIRKPSGSIPKKVPTE